MPAVEEERKPATTAIKPLAAQEAVVKVATDPMPLKEESARGHWNASAWPEESLASPVRAQTREAG
jgi:hypothetical protein